MSIHSNVISKGGAPPIISSHAFGNAVVSSGVLSPNNDGAQADKVSEYSSRYDVIDDKVEVESPIGIRSVFLEDIL